MSKIKTILQMILSKITPIILNFGEFPGFEPCAFFFGEPEYPEECK